MKQKLGASGQKGRSQEGLVDPDLKIKDPLKSREMIKKMEGARGRPLQNRDLQGVGDKKLKRTLKTAEKKHASAQEQAARTVLTHHETAGYLEAEGMEKTYHFSQPAIVGAVDVQTAKKRFSLTLPDAPYMTSFSSSGKDLLIAGNKGHVAMMDWRMGKVSTEFHVKETIRDITFLHNYTMFAVAQKKYVHIYDHQGLEIHCVRDHVDVNKLAFLPAHFLLASIGAGGVLKYQDTSTGGLVAEHRSGNGPCFAMTASLYNGIVCTGHGNGTVALWSPNASKPLLRMLAHKGPIACVATSPTAPWYWLSAGCDGIVKVWDIRAVREVCGWKPLICAPTSMAVSSTGLIALTTGNTVQVSQLSSQHANRPVPYLNGKCTPGARGNSLAFCPWEDVLAVGTTSGVETMLVPGAGVAQIDSRTADPFQTRVERREAEVHALLDKIPASAISLDPHEVGVVRTSADDYQLKQHQSALAASAKGGEKKPVERNRKRGRNKIARKLKRKQHNVMDAKRMELIASLEAQQAKHAIHTGKEAAPEPSVLDRFK